MPRWKSRLLYSLALILAKCRKLLKARIPLFSTHLWNFYRWKSSSTKSVKFRRIGKIVLELRVVGSVCNLIELWRHSFRGFVGRVVFVAWRGILNVAETTCFHCYYSFVIVLTCFHVCNFLSQVYAKLIRPNEALSFRDEKVSWRLIDFFLIEWFNFR